MEETETGAGDGRVPTGSATVSESLQQLAYPPEPILGKLTVHDGTIVVIAKRGRALKVAIPGLVYKRGWHLPLLGKLTGYKLSTATATLSVELTDVRTRDAGQLANNQQFRFALKRVVATYEVQLTPLKNSTGQDDWTPLLEYIRKQSTNVADRLKPRLEGELRNVIENTVLEYSHSDLMDKHLRAEAFDVTGTRLLGLYEISGIVGAPAIEYDESFAQLATGGNRTLVGADEIRTAGTLAHEQRNELEGMARRQEDFTQIPAAEFSDAETVEKLREASFRHYEITAGISRHGAGTDMLSDAAEAAKPPMYGRLTRPEDPPLEPADLRTPDHLDFDATILGLFSRYTKPEALRGLTIAKNQHAAVVVCVTDDPDILVRSRAELEDAIGRTANLDSIEIYAIRYEPSLTDLVDDYLRQRLALVDGERLVTGTRWLSNGTLVLLLGCSGDQAIRYRREIMAPRNLILEPLHRLLPEYSAIDLISKPVKS